jgi:serine/threonine-protein kinase
MTHLQDEVEERARARVGQTLRGKWRLDRLLGVGGMAAVYAATHRNGNVGAVKMLHPEHSLSTQARSRFSREGYVANKVGHPGAVAVLDDDVAEDGSVFLVMELLEGEPLASLAARRAGQITITEVLDITDALLDVLVAAHGQGIVHRDLKPDNLFLTTRGELKVLDFGIARLRDAPGADHATKSGIMLGTPAFLPPEQAQGEWDRVDARTDLWAVGATVFSLLTGRHVHQEPTLMRLLVAAMSRPAPPLATVLPDAPAAVCALVDRALAFEPENRWPDAWTMQLAVRGAREQLGDTGSTTATSTRSAPISIATIPTYDAGSIRGVVAPRMVQDAVGSTSTAEPVSSDRAAAPPRTWNHRRIVAVVALAAAWATTAALLLPRTTPTPAVDAAPIAATATTISETIAATATTISETIAPATPAPVEPTAASASAAPPISARASASGRSSAAGPRAAAAPTPATSPEPPALAAPSASSPPGGNVASAIRDRK